MGFEEAIQIVSTLGFPIFVAIWLLWREDKRQKEFIEVQRELTKAMNELKIEVAMNRRFIENICNKDKKVEKNE